MTDQTEAMDLTRAKIAFQLSAIIAAMGLPHDSRSRIECNEWADEATSALEASNG